MKIDATQVDGSSNCIRRAAEPALPQPMAEDQPVCISAVPIGRAADSWMTAQEAEEIAVNPREIDPSRFPVQRKRSVGFPVSCQRFKRLGALFPIVEVRNAHVHSRLAQSAGHP